MGTRKCKHCDGGFLNNRFGQDVVCVNGVLIDEDEFSEGHDTDCQYPVAPCHPSFSAQQAEDDFDNDSLKRLSDEATARWGSKSKGPTQ